MRGIISGKKGEGDVVTAFAPTPGQPAPRSTGRPTQPGTNTPAPGTKVISTSTPRMQMRWRCARPMPSSGQWVLLSFHLI
jgi:hypothetical protein